MYGLFAGVLLAAGMVWLVLDPILRPRAPAAGDLSVDPDDDLSPRAVALRALAEIEFDRATGKLSPADYESLKARYTRDAVDALRVPASPRVSAPPAVAPPAAVVPPPAVPVFQASSGQLRCPVHGPAALPGSKFCSSCGRRLGIGGEGPYCGACGSPLEAESQFCGRCGKRVAA
ncbi:MAG TPA: zinc ribbon domain-containing protein [Gemmatimonadales bacterium]|nr:zinc ribbon domain-containing protein [Gemmatimonadales bacterium]